MSQDETLDKWITIFCDVYSPDMEISNPANEAIHDKFQNDQRFLIDVSTNLLMFEDCDDDKIMKAKSLSAVILSQILNIRKNNLNDLRNNLIKNEELTEQVINSLKQNVFSAETSIRNLSAECYSYLFAILTQNWKDGIDDIVKSFNNTNLLPYGFIHLISIMSEIVNLIKCADGIVPYFNEQFVQTIVFCIDILSKDPTDENFIPELRIEACKFIHDIISINKEILDDEGNESAKISALLENITNSFQINNIDLFSNLHQLLLIIVKQFYPQSPTFIGLIASLMENCLEFFSDNPEFENISIMFWKDIANLEGKIISQNNINENLYMPNTTKPLKPLLIETIFEKFVPILFYFIENVNENDTDVEDIEKKPEPSMCSTVTLASFFNLLPQVIFLMASQRVEELISKAESWTQIHAAIILIYSFADGPKRDDVCQFISDKYDMLLDASLPHQVPRLRETAFFVIGLVIKNYPQIITMGSDPDKRITDLFNSFEQSLNIDDQQQSNKSYGQLQIFTRFTSIIYHLCQESEIYAYFDKIYEILEILFEIGITNNDYMLIKNSSEALNRFIFESTPDLSSKLGDLYISIIDSLDRSRTRSLAQKTLCVVQSSYCSSISTILLKLKKILRPNNHEIISAYAGRTLELLYELLNTKDDDIFEEGLMAISALVNATSYPLENYYIELFNQDSFNTLIYDFIYNSFTFTNSGVINASCLLIGNLYYFRINKIPELIEILPSLFSLLKNEIQDKNLRDSYPFILKAIADMFDSLDKIEGMAIPDFENELHDLLTKIYDLSTELDITNKNDVEYGNTFYQYLSDAFRGYAKIYYSKENQEKEREQLFLLDKLANYIYKLSPNIDDAVYLSFAKTARQFAEYCSRRNGCVLNRHSVHRILKQGYDQTKSSLIRRVIDFLKSR